MPKITALEPQRRKGRLNVFVDGRFVVGVGETVAANLGLRVGKEVDRDRLHEIVAAEEIAKAYELALRGLDVRARSEREIVQRLTRAGYDETTIRAVVDKLKGARLIDDDAFASQWVEARMRPEGSRPIGRRRAAQELVAKGVDKAVAQEALGAVSDDDEYSLALAAAQKKVRAVPRGTDALLAERRKLIGFLQRRGFQWDTIKTAVAEVLGGEVDDVDDPADE